VYIGAGLGFIQWSTVHNTFIEKKELNLALS
jgi:hypothetical protein